MKLVSALTAAGSSNNEDAFGYCERDGELEAAWVIDGVTGINERNILPSTTDAIWFVDQVQLHLPRLAGRGLALPKLLHQLTTLVMADWELASKDLVVPPDYDLPACCLLLVQKSKSGWQAMRLGDSYLLSQSETLVHHASPPSNLGELEQHLKDEALKRRNLGQLDFKALLAEFRPQLRANRRSRNKPGSYSIVEPSLAALNSPQLIDLGWPEVILLCTDGFYRCVDHYEMHDDQTLLTACKTQNGAEKLMQDMRKLENEDADCTRYMRFKPQDDATVLTLIST